MAQLILTIIAIALFGLLSLATINFTPWWYKTAAVAEEVTKSSFRTLEQSYDLSVRLNDGAIPQVNATAADGGLAQNFIPVIKHIPPAVPGFTWKYGQSNGSNYFCMEGEGLAVNEGAFRGINRAKALFPETQMFISDTCGAASNNTALSGSSSSVAVTLFVEFVPGLSR